MRWSEIVLSKVAYIAPSDKLRTEGETFKKVGHAIQIMLAREGGAMKCIKLKIEEKTGCLIPHRTSVDSVAARACQKHNLIRV